MFKKMSRQTRNLGVIMTSIQDLNRKLFELSNKIIHLTIQNNRLERTVNSLTEKLKIVENEVLSEGGGLQTLQRDQGIVQNEGLPEGGGPLKPLVRVPTNKNDDAVPYEPLKPLLREHCKRASANPND